MLRDNRTSGSVGIGIVSLAVAIAGCSNDENGDGERRPANRDEAEKFAMDEFEVLGAGESLIDPAQDDSVTTTSTGNGVLTFSAGATITVSIPFEAPNGNVVGAGIRFGEEGPITTVPLPSFGGATSGTLAFDVRVPNDICDQLGSICHDIRCYEFAVTDAGMVSAANIQAMASTCGDCTEPSCVGVIDGCEAAPIEVPANYCPAPEAEELYRSASTGNGIAVDESFVYFGKGEDVVRLAKDGSGELETLWPDIGVSRNFLWNGETLHFQAGLTLYGAETGGGEPTVLANSVGHFVSDGESFFTTSSSFVCLDSSDIRRIEMDGTDTLLIEDGPCVQHLAVDAGYLYMLAEVAEDEFQLMRMNKSGGTPESLGSTGPYAGPLLVNDSYLYFQHSEGITTSLMVRMAKGGGAIETFDMESHYAGSAVLDVSSQDVFFNDYRYYGCLRRIDAAGNITAVAANPLFSNALAVDSTHVYAISLDEALDAIVLRAPKL